MGLGPLAIWFYRLVPCCCLCFGSHLAVWPTRAGLSLTYFFILFVILLHGLHLGGMRSFKKGNDNTQVIVGYWRKYVHFVLVNRVGDLSLSRNSVSRLPTGHDLNSVDWAVRNQTNKAIRSVPGLILGAMRNPATLDCGTYFTASLLLFCYTSYCIIWASSRGNLSSGFATR